LPFRIGKQHFETNSDGTMGSYKTPHSISNQIGEGQKKRDYSTIRVPVLAFFEFPRSTNDPPQTGKDQPGNAEERAAREAYNTATAAFVERWTKNLKSGVPGARLVDLPGAGHYVFLTREPEVLRGLQEFVAGLR
jgi:hypothetical protein